MRGLVLGWCVALASGLSGVQPRPLVSQAGHLPIFRDATIVAVTGQSGGTIVRGPGQIVVQPQQPARDTRAALPPGTGRISGHATDSVTGTAVRRATVRLIESGSRETRTVTTNADGRFEFLGLRPGGYQVLVTKSGYVNWSYNQKHPNESAPPFQLADAQSLEQIDVRLPRGGVVTGQIVDEFGEPVADALVSAMQHVFTPSGSRLMALGRAGQSNDIGEFRISGLPPGEYFIAAAGPPRFLSPLERDDSDRSGYAMSFYPGVTDTAAAQAVRVAIGQTLGGVSISLIPARTALVSGTVFDDEGLPVRSGMVLAQQRSRSGPGGVSTSIREDGSFTLSGVAPGSYLIRSSPVMNGPAGPTPRFLAVAAVTVSGDDLAGIRVAPRPPIRISGRLLIDPGAASEFRPRAVRVIATSLDDLPFSAPNQSPEPVRDDGTFSTQALEGAHVLRVAGLAPGWLVRRVLWRGVDVTDRLNVPADGVEDLDIEVTNRAPTFTGRVMTSDGKETRDFVVVVFPQDDALWSTARMTRQTLARADAQGRFTLRTLPEGDYYAIALDHLGNGQSYDPAFLESIRRRATRVTLREGDTQALDLTLQVAP